MHFGNIEVGPSRPAAQQHPAPAALGQRDEMDTRLTGLLQDRGTPFPPRGLGGAPHAVWLFAVNCSDFACLQTRRTAVFIS